MMRAALALARRSLGRTWPNPAVGCVIERSRATNSSAPPAPSMYENMMLVTRRLSSISSSSSSQLWLSRVRRCWPGTPTSKPLRRGISPLT